MADVPAPVTYRKAATPGTPRPSPAPGAGTPRPLQGARTLSQGTPSSDFVRATYEVARKEFLQAIRTKRLLVIGIVFSVLLGVITLGFGPAVMRGEGGDMDGVSREHVVLLFYFAVGLIGGLQFTQLLAIVLTGDAVCSEWSSRTIFLLLSKPVSRTAFVIGKFLGAAFTVCATLLALFTVDYLLMQPFYAGSPSAAEVGGFFAMLGIVLLGAVAFAALSLFVSTLTRSTVMSLLLVLALWLIIFPLVGNAGFFMELGSDDPDLESDSVEAWRYLNPAADMQAGARLLAAEDSDASEAVLFLNVFQTAPDSVPIAILALCLHIVVWLGLALLVVQRRNFE